MARILVVDDVRDVRDLLAEMLSFGGHETITAADGEQALQQFEHEQPDLMMLDISMPGMDGFEVLTALRERGQAESVPVVMMTAFDDPYMRDKALKLGARDYFVKGSFDMGDMLARIGRYAGGDGASNGDAATDDAS